MKVLKCKETNKDIENKCNEIIDLLHSFSTIGKYKVVQSLYYSLTDIIKKEGYIIIEKESKEKK